MIRLSAQAAARLRAMVQIDHPDAVVALRGKLLNLLALLCVGIFLVGLVYLVVIVGAADVESVLRAGLAEAVCLGLLGVVLALNHHGYSRVAAWLFLLGLLVLMALGDDPQYVIGGRSTILFCIPIVMGSAVAAPAASFILASLSGLILYGLAWGTGLVWDPLALSIPVSLIIFFIVALISWLTASRLEYALVALQVMNRDLEQRVTLRTRELASANEKLRVMNERLIAQDRLRSAFVSMITHDLRAPLVGILSNTEMLGVNVFGVLTNSQRDAIERIAHNTHSLLRLVNDLLDESQIEAGQILTLHLTHFSPADLLDETVSAVSDLAQAKDLKLISRLSDDLPYLLFGDPQRLAQILINLTVNAIKFTDSGTVEIVLARHDETHWQMQIRDTGPGIPPGEQATIFEPFRRGKSAGGIAGVGLGLSIVKHVVDLMDGEIQLVSNPGRGSEFTVILRML